MHEILSAPPLTLAAAYLHDLDPFAIRFPDGFFLPGIRWYGLSYLAGFVAGWALLRPLARRGRLGGVRVEEIGDLIFWAAVGAVLGGRLGYAIFYNFIYTALHPWTLPFVWQGGMASHGGMIGVALAVGLWWQGRGEGGPAGENGFSQGSGSEVESAAPASRRKERKSRAKLQQAVAARPSLWSRLVAAYRSAGFWRVADGLCAVAPAGLFFGRMANFVNGELWGRPTGSDWGVVFPLSPEPLVPRHPSQLYEAALEGILLLAWLYPGVWRGRWSAGGASVRFLIGYAAARFVVEFFREPDAEIGYQWLHLTRGQWLSFAMAVIGFWLLRRLRSRNAILNPGNQSPVSRTG
jgi:phosphatidylglycerol:prolipoprotein diacylglycerol transferase